MAKGVKEALCGELKALGVSIGVAEALTPTPFGNPVRNRLPGANLHVLSCCMTNNQKTSEVFTRKYVGLYASQKPLHATYPKHCVEGR